MPEFTDAIQKKGNPAADDEAHRRPAPGTAGISATDAQPAAARNDIKDWSSVPIQYRNAVSTCYALKLLSGMGDGSCSGANTMTLAQACVVLTKLEGIS